MSFIPIDFYPWLLQIDLSDEIDDEMNNKLFEQCIESDNEERPGLEKNTYNTPMKDTDELINLYNLFKGGCHKMFSNIPENCLSQNPQKSHGYAYVSYGEKRYDSYWHNHCNRATINSVYYVSVPDDNGSLGVMTEICKEKKVTPLEKHLYLMPGWLSHKPYPCKSEEPRISINMEFLSDTRAILRPENFPLEIYEDWDKGALIVW